VFERLCEKRYVASATIAGFFDLNGFLTIVPRFSNIITMEGTTNRINKVPSISPNTMDVAMGIRN
jgi:hypothetical protein